MSVGQSDIVVISGVVGIVVDVVVDGVVVTSGVVVANDVEVGGVVVFSGVVVVGGVACEDNDTALLLGTSGGVVAADVTVLGLNEVTAGDVDVCCVVVEGDVLAVLP